jgi:outer membrane protein OmpA-like peptidoglycan-associated protein
MKAYLALTFLVLFSCGRNIVCAQNVAVVNHFQGDTTGLGIEKFRLAQSSEQKIVINYYEPIEENELDRLEELIAASLSFYIDHTIVCENNRYVFKKSRKLVLKDLNEIVGNSIRFYEFKEIKSFEGFSQSIQSELLRLEEEDLSKKEWAKTTRDPKKLHQLTQEHSQMELRKLKDMAISEVEQFSSQNLVSFSNSETTYSDTRTTEQLIADMTSFDPEAMLPIREITDDGSSFTVLSVEDKTKLPQMNPSNGARAFDNDLFMQQMLEMMQLNNAEMRAMREEFNEFRDDQMAMWKEAEQKNNANLQAQIDDLKGMVVEIIRHDNGDDSIVSSDPVMIKPNTSNSSGFPVNLPRFVIVYFSSGSVQLNAASLLSLNEIIDLLARNPQLNIIITGHADSTGDEMKNLLLSQERARAVKKFLSQSGLEETRFITKFLGEKDAIESNQLDRRVSLEFVLQ